MRALILCAGHGTRLGKLTKDTPKCMLKVGGKPVLEHLVDHLKKYGITEIIVNLHHKPEKIMNYFGTRLLYFYEPKLLGERGTEKALLSWLKPAYFVMNGDTLTNINPHKLNNLLHIQGFTQVKFIDGLTYAGTKAVYIPDDGSIYEFEDKSAYWFDIGTPEGLKKARRHFIDEAPPISIEKD